MSALEEWAKREQAQLWAELEDQLRRAINGHWSMGATGVCHRLIGVARLVGPTPRDEIPWPIDAGKVYDTLMEIAGVGVTDRSPEDQQRAENLMREFAEPVDALRVRYTPTCAAIRAERETLLDQE